MSTAVPFSVSSGRQSIRDRYAGSRSIGKWRLTHLLARGQLTSTYCAQPQGCSASWPSDYVVKMLRGSRDEDPLAIDVLRREAEIGRLVSHSHLVPILDAHVEGSPYFIVMPRLGGTSLDQVIAEVGRIRVPQALWIVRQIAEALQTVHREGWIHADVKPSNLVVAREGHATLIDLGCALREDESILSWDRPVVGTLHYVAPEMIHSTIRTDHRSDIYSLGVTLFQMLTGRLPFDGRSPQELVEAHLRQAMPDPRPISADINDDIAELLRCMLAKEPLRRPQNAEELIERLVRLELETMDHRWQKAA